MVPFVSLKEGGWAIISMSVRAHRCNWGCAVSLRSSEAGVLSCPPRLLQDRGCPAPATQPEKQRFLNNSLLAERITIKLQIALGHATQEVKRAFVFAVVMERKMQDTGNGIVV